MQKMSIYLVLFGVLIASFQNCADMKFSKDETEVGSINTQLSVPSMQFEGGKPFTNRLGVKLEISATGYDEMYLSSDSECKGEPTWEKIVDNKDWYLTEKNTVNAAYGIFKAKDGQISPCVNASIVHDSIAPAGKYLQQPKQYINVNTAKLEYDANDENSGVDLIECKKGNLPINSCDKLKELDNLSEGTHTIYYRATDKAGNTSDFLPASWWVDTVKPTIVVKKTPDAMSTKNYAEIIVEASDGDGSGIDKYNCVLNNKVEENCDPTFLARDLKDGDQLFEIIAVDKAGNTSDQANVKWLVDTEPSGDFDILGITGDKENKIDAFLGTSPNPTIHWTESKDSAKYSVSILDKTLKKACADSVTTETQYKYSAEVCSLENGKEYAAQVVAYDNLGNSRSKTYTFKADLVGPRYEITLGAPIYKDMFGTITVDFKIEDDISGVDSASCYRIFGNDTVTYQCKNLTTLTFSNLAKGDYYFYISASDLAGNSSSSDKKPFSIQPTPPPPLVDKPGVVTILLALGDKDNLPNPTVDQVSAQAVAEKMVQYASPVQKPKVLVVLDRNHNNESPDDFTNLWQNLLDRYTPSYMLEPEGGLKAANIANYDVVWLVNPGYKMGSIQTYMTLKAFTGGVVLSGDDMSKGKDFEVSDLTGLNHIDNGTELNCNGQIYNIDNNLQNNAYEVTLDATKFPDLGANHLRFVYGNDIDNTRARAGIEVLAYAKGTPPGCTEKRPVIVRYPKQ